jgi:peptidoglycan/LPS O-acetylase OafA/YrhL
MMKEQIFDRSYENSLGPVRKAASTQIYGLDFLRFFAAVLVAMYHLTFTIWSAPLARQSPDFHFYDAYHPLASWFGTGWVGVQVFFVISGFVIAYTANGKSPLTFLNSRFLRLWPGVFIVATLAVPLLLWGGQSMTKVAHAYLKSLIIWPLGPWVASAFWTLTIEILFYALIFLALCRDRFVWIERIAVVLGLVSTAVWIGYLLRPVVPSHLFDTVFRIAGASKPARFLLLQDGCFFALGTMLWIIRYSGLNMRRLCVTAALVGGGVLEIVAETQKANLWNGYPSHASVPVLIWLACLATLVAFVVWNDQVARLIGNRSRQIRTIGLLTYPLYLVHLPVGLTLLPKLCRLGIHPFLALVLVLSIALIVALIVAEVLEPALRASMGRMLKGAEAAYLPLRWDTLRKATTALPSSPVAPPGLARETPP